jgi:hypothetical protein
MGQNSDFEEVEGKVPSDVQIKVTQAAENALNEGVGEWYRNS